MNKIISMSILMLLLLSSCTSTQMTSIVDPDYRNKKVQHILIIAKVDDLNQKQDIESKFSGIFERTLWGYTYDTKYILKASKSYEVLPPTRSYTEADLIKAFKKNGIDSVLIVEISGQGYEKSQMTINQPYQTSGTINKTGTNQYNYQTTTYGGPQTYNIEKPRLMIKTQLVDSITGKTMWVASSFSRGNSYANLDSTWKDYIKSVLNKLNEDGFLIPVPQPKKS